MLEVIATITAQPGQADALRAVLTELVRESRTEAGCTAYSLLQREDRPEVFVTVESWTDAAALELHFGSDHLRTASRAMKTLLAAAPEIVRYRSIC